MGNPMLSRFIKIFNN